MKIILNAGHTLSGIGTGAVGICKETDKNRQILNRLTEMFKEKGHTVINATVDKSKNDLSDICKLANTNKGADLFISLHLNAFSDPNANGVETFHYSSSSKGKEYANKVQKELVSKTGWYNRGVKTANFYVLKNTSMPSILLELGFCTSKVDMDKWNTENICKAIFKGITNKEYETSNTNKTQGYMITKYLQEGRKCNGKVGEGLDMEYILPYFKRVRCYIKSDSKGLWIETQWLPLDKLKEVEKSIGIWKSSIKYK